MDECCLILMASYNGENFIKEQINSIRNQTMQSWKLLIRDDGSQDGTIDIIKQCIQLDNRIMLLENDSEIHGAYHNFWHLIHYAKSIEKYHYYFFADQDDIWVQDKMEVMVKDAEKRDSEKVPSMYYSDLSIIDKDGHIVYPSKNKYTGIGSVKGLTPFYVHNYFPGCSMMINKALFELVPSFPLDHPAIGIMSHDNYHAKIALAHGKIHFIDHICLLHRIHENNVSSATIKLNPKLVLQKSVFGFDTLARTHARVYAQTLLTIEQMEKNNLMTNELAEARTAINSGGLKAVRILFRHQVRRKQLSRSIGVYVIMFLKSYQKYLYEFLDETL